MIYQTILRKTGVYTAAVFAGRLASLLLLPLYTRYLTPADYGALELLELTANFIGTILSVRLFDGLLYYYSEAPTKEARDGYVSSSFLGFLFIGALGGGLAYLLSGHVSAAVFGSTERSMSNGGLLPIPALDRA